MIYEFGFNNYFSFKEGASISFRTSEKDKYNENSIYPIIGIKGANASGKTHIIRALNFLADFCVHSFSHEPESKLRIKSFFNSKEPSYFYIEFKVNEIEYIYETKVTEDNILEEKLSLLKDEQVIFERHDNKVSFQNQLPSLELVSFRNNASVLSTLKQYSFIDIDEHLSNSFLFFGSVVTNVDFRGMRSQFSSVENMSEFYHNNPNVFSLVKEFIKENDLGISDIDIDEVMNKDGSKSYLPIFSHKCEGENGLAKLTYFHESSGTIRLYTELLRYFWVIQRGGVLALDEFDTHLHSLVLPRLLALFESKEINKNGAQFLFTAHNTEIMDYLGKYRTVLVEKEKSESFCYRLDEIPGEMLNGNRAVSQLYLSGRLGGVPNL